MAVITTDNKHYSDIAKAIRGVSGSVETLKPADMATMISGLKPAKIVKMTMTQSCTHGGGAKAIIDSIRDESAMLSVLVYNGSNPVDRQLGALACVLINGNTYYCGLRKNGSDYASVVVEGNWDYIINIGDEYILYEM